MKHKTIITNFLVILLLLTINIQLQASQLPKTSFSTTAAQRLWQRACRAGDKAKKFARKAKHFLVLNLCCCCVDTVDNEDAYQEEEHSENTKTKVDDKHKQEEEDIYVLFTVRKHECYFCKHPELFMPTLHYVDAVGASNHQDGDLGEDGVLHYCDDCEHAFCDLHIAALGLHRPHGFACPFKEKKSLKELERELDAALATFRKQRLSAAEIADRFEKMSLHSYRY